MCQKPHLSLIGIGCPAQSPCYGELEVLVLAAFESDKASDKGFTGKLVCRIAGNFSEIETFTIFASRHENAKV